MKPTYTLSLASAPAVASAKVAAMIVVTMTAVMAMVRIRIIEVPVVADWCGLCTLLSYARAAKSPAQGDKYLCCASQQISNVDVRFGSKADIGASPNHVRFTPKSGH